MKSDPKSPETKEMSATDSQWFEWGGSAPVGSNGTWAVHPELFIRVGMQ